jgi:hypothetical protein
MEENIQLYASLFNKLGDYNKKKTWEKETYLKEIVNSYKEIFSKKTGFRSQLVYRYLIGSAEWEPTESIINQPSLIGLMKKALQKWIAEMKGKIYEIQKLKRQI